eukprot:g433.t1
MVLPSCRSPCWWCGTLLFALHATGPCTGGVQAGAVDKLWSYKTGNGVNSSPALSHDGKVVYVGSNDNSLYAINATDGSKLWSYKTGNRVTSSPALSTDGKVVYVGSNDNSLYAINAADGSKLWSYETGGWVSSSPAVSHDGKVVYSGGGDRSLYAINAADGSKLWSYRTGFGVYSSPALSPDGKVVYVGSYDKSLYAINAADGSKLWSYKTGERVYSSPALSPDGKVVYVGSWDKSLYAINAADGSKLWSYETGSGVNSSPALSTDGKVVYVGNFGNSLYAINAADSSKLWSYKTGDQVSSSPALSPDGKVVYVGSYDNSLYAINAADGSKLWSYETGNGVSSSPALSPDGKQIIIGLGLGLLAIILAALLDLRYRSDNRSHSTPIFAAIGLADIAVDVLTASRYFQGPTYADFPTERAWWGGIFVATLVMPVIGNVIILARFVRREGRASPPFLAWMQNHMGKLRLIFFLTSLKYGSIRLIHCRVAGLGFLSAPLTRRTINKLRTYGTITAVVQDLPQLALVIYVAIKTDKSTWLTGAKIGLSVLTFLMAVVALIIGLIAVRLSNREEDGAEDILGDDDLLSGE